MAVRETLELDLRRALAQVQTLENEIDDLGQPVVIPLDVRGEEDLRDVDRRLEEIESGVGEINRELAGMELATGEAIADFSRLASELNISESEARDLTREILEARNASERTVEAAKDVARQLGLSEDEAARFASEVGTGARRMDDLDDASRRAHTGVEKLRTGFGKLVVAAAAFIGIRELGRFASDSIKAFSDLEESSSKARVVFGEFADEVFAFTENAPTQLGNTRAAAIEMAASFGNLFLSVGLGQEAAAEMSTTLVQLGSDIASFNNISVDEALEKLRSGLVGQAEPLRTVGVLLSEAAVLAKGFELGLGDATGKLSEAEKVQARYAIILEQTTTAQGDFARTADGIANSSRTAAALFGELKTAVGEGLAPAFAALVDLAPEIIGAFEDMIPAITNASLALADFFTPKEGQADLLDFIDLLLSIPQGFGQLTDALLFLPRDLAAEWSEASDSIGHDLEETRGQGRDLVETNESVINTLKRITLAGLVQDLREGRNATDAFAEAWLSLVRAPGRLTIDREFVERLAAVAGIDLSQQAAAIQEILDRAQEFGLAGGEVSFLEGMLVELNEAFYDGSRANEDYRASWNDLQGALETGGDNLLSQIDILSLLAAEADIAGVSIQELLTNAADFPELGDLIGQLTPAAVQLGIVRGELASFAATFEEINVRVSGAIDELGLLPEKLKTTKDKFLANLRISAAEEAEFQLNLVRLFSIAPALATKFQQEGPATRELVKGFLADSTSAREAESILTGNAEAITGTFTQALEDELGATDLDPLGVKKLEEFLEGFGNTLIAEAGVRALERKIQDAIDDMNFTIRGDQIVFGGGGFTTFVGDLPTGGGVVVINNINNPTTTDLETSVAQANQSTAAVGGLLNGITQN